MDFKENFALKYSYSPCHFPMNFWKVFCIPDLSQGLCPSLPWPRTTSAWGGGRVLKPPAFLRELGQGTRPQKPPEVAASLWLVAWRWHLPPALSTGHTCQGMPGKASP